MAIWADLYIACPACIAMGRDPGPASYWYHYHCGGVMEVSDEAVIRCKRCGAEGHVKDWRWYCPRHGDDPDNLDYYYPTNSSSIAAQISVAAALTPKLGKAWLQRFLENLGDW